MKRGLLSRGIAGLLLLAAGCGGTGTGSVPAFPRAAPDYIEHGGGRLTLTAFLWRDFMPGIGPPTERRLIGTLSVKAVSGSEPPGLQPIMVWVMRGEEVWWTDRIEFAASATPNARDFLVRNGPLWEPGERADVAVQLQDSRGDSYVLQARNVSIDATY